MNLTTDNRDMTEIDRWQTAQIEALKAEVKRLQGIVTVFEQEIIPAYWAAQRHDFLQIAES